MGSREIASGLLLVIHVGVKGVVKGLSLVFGFPLAVTIPTLGTVPAHTYSSTK